MFDKEHQELYKKIDMNISSVVSKNNKIRVNAYIRPVRLIRFSKKKSSFYFFLTNHQFSG